MEPRHHALIEVRNVLADLYPTESLARVVVRDVGLDPGRVDFHGSAQTFWFCVIEHAEAVGATAALCEYAAKAYPARAATLVTGSTATPSRAASARPPFVAPGDVYEPAWHVERRAEAEALDLLDHASTPCGLFGPAHCGRAWMVDRLVARYVDRNEGNRQAVRVSFGLMDIATFDTFLLALAEQVVGGIGGDVQRVDHYWRRTPNKRAALTDCVEHLILRASERETLIAFDVEDDPPVWAAWWQFQGVLREWHRRAAKAPWDRLRMLVAMSTTPGEWDGTPRSAFKVPTIELEDFSREEVRELAWRHGIAWTPQEIGAVMGVAGGHPYLVRLVLYELAARGQVLDDVLRRARQGIDGLFGEHLAKLRRWLDARPAAREEFRIVCEKTGHRVQPREVFLQLRAGGLVVADDGGDRPRLPLYRALAEAR